MNSVFSVLTQFSCCELMISVISGSKKYLVYKVCSLSNSIVFWVLKIVIKSLKMIQFGIVQITSCIKEHVYDYIYIYIYIGLAMGRVWIMYTHTLPEKFTHGYPIINTHEYPYLNLTQIYYTWISIPYPKPIYLFFLIQNILT